MKMNCVHFTRTRVRSFNGIEIQMSDANVDEMATHCQEQRWTVSETENRVIIHIK